MRTVDLPLANYHHESQYVFGPWVELWIVTEPELAVRRRHGWVVEIGRGVSGKERPFLSLRSVDRVFDVPTKGNSRLAFRAGGRDQVSDDKYPTESLTEEEARLRHPDHEVPVHGIFDENGDRREVVFVWEDIGADEKAAVAFYWLAPTKIH